MIHHHHLSQDGRPVALTHDHGRAGEPHTHDPLAHATRADTTTFPRRVNVDDLSWDVAVEDHGDNDYSFLWHFGEFSIAQVTFTCDEDGNIVSAKSGLARNGTDFYNHISDWQMLDLTAMLNETVQGTPASEHTTI